MSTFIEVDSVEKSCKVIINLDSVIEIAPLAAGGCALFFADSAATNGKSSYLVKDNYEQFKQFAMQTVTAESIAARFPSKKDKKETAEKIEIPKF